MKYFYCSFQLSPLEDQGTFYSWIIYLFTKYLLSTMYLMMTGILLCSSGAVLLDDASENTAKGFYFPYGM